MFQNCLTYKILSLHSALLNKVLISSSKNAISDPVSKLMKEQQENLK